MFGNASSTDWGGSYTAFVSVSLYIYIYIHTCLVLQTRHVKAVARTLSEPR